MKNSEKLEILLQTLNIRPAELARRMEVSPSHITRIGQDKSVSKPMQHYFDGFFEKHCTSNTLAESPVSYSNKKPKLMTIKGVPVSNETHTKLSERAEREGTTPEEEAGSILEALAKFLSIAFLFRAALNYLEQDSKSIGEAISLTFEDSATLISHIFTSII